MSVKILISISIALFIVVLVVLLVLKSYKKRNTVFSKIAERFQLTFEAAEGVHIFNQRFPKAHGSIDGIPVVIDMYVVSSGNSHVEYNRVMLGLGGSNHKDLCLTKENFFRKMGKLVGMQDIVIGKPEMDDHFIIKSSDENYAKYVLNQKVCLHILEMTFGGSLNVKDGNLIYVESGIPRSDSRLMSFYSNVLSLINVAKAMN